MKIVVLGAGVIGVTTAYFLARAGHEVTVLERQDGPALETSFANAGEISPGYASPWAGPGVPAKALRWLTMEHPPLIVKPRADIRMARWLWQMLGNCTEHHYAINKGRMVRLAEYSRDVLRSLRAETGIAYDERMAGTLQLFTTQKQVDDAQKDIAVLQNYGVAYELLDRKGCEAAEPGLAASAAPIAGGLRLPADETGDCHMFTTRLAELAVGLGVEFRYGTTVSALQAEGGQVTGCVLASGERVHGDAYVVALGSFSPMMVRQLGIDLPIYPVKGYSITAEIRDAGTAPVSTVLHETYKIAVTRLGNRIRAGGMAELSGYNLDLSDKRRQTLVHCVEELFPGAGDTAKASFWTGMRPMTPDSTPIVGKGHHGNLFINAGHGTLGWTMACGSARIIADLVSARQPDIETKDLSLARYGA